MKKQVILNKCCFTPYDILAFFWPSPLNKCGFTPYDVLALNKCGFTPYDVLAFFGPLSPPLP